MAAARKASQCFRSVICFVQGLSFERAAVTVTQLWGEQGHRAPNKSPSPRRPPCPCRPALPPSTPSPLLDRIGFSSRILRGASWVPHTPPLLVAPVSLNGTSKMCCKFVSRGQNAKAKNFACSTLLCSTLLCSMLEGDYSPSDSGDEQPSAAPPCRSRTGRGGNQRPPRCSLQQLHQIQPGKVYAIEVTERPRSNQERQQEICPK